MRTCDVHVPQRGLLIGVFWGLLMTAAMVLGVAGALQIVV